MKFWNTIREVFRPIPFNPIMQSEDLVCTHDGSSSCPVKIQDPRDWGAQHYAGVYVPPKDPRYGTMSFDQGGETVWPK